MKKFLTAFLTFACTSAFTASAGDMSTEFYGFGINQGNFATKKAVSFGKIDVTYNPDIEGSEWSWNKEELWGANYEEGWVNHTINSAWIYNGFIYGSRYHFSTGPQDSENDSDLFWNDVVQMDSEGNLVKVINVGFESKYGYIVKALLNPSDNMLYCWTSDFYDNIYFGKISPDRLNNFAAEFQEIKKMSFWLPSLPLTFCAKGEEFFYFGSDLTLKSITPAGEETRYGTLTGVNEFTPTSWIIGSNYSGLGMIYSEEIDRFIWTSPYGISTGDDENSTSFTSRAYSFALPDEGATSIINKTITAKNIAGSIPDSYWTAFLAPGQVQRVDPGTPKAPEDVMISETDTPNIYKISWSAVTECVEEGKTLDIANLTYRVLLNDEIIEQSIDETYAIVNIEPADKPMDYTAHVWAVCPNAESAEASSNTITIGVSGIELGEAENGSYAIYNALGARVKATSLTELPSGLYIINGKKVMVK